jgi:hypothetical protein
MIKFAESDIALMAVSDMGSVYLGNVSATTGFQEETAQLYATSRVRPARGLRLQSVLAATPMLLIPVAYALATLIIFKIAPLKDVSRSAM